MNPKDMDLGGDGAWSCGRMDCISCRHTGGWWNAGLVMDGACSPSAAKKVIACWQWAIAALEEFARANRHLLSNGNQSAQA